VSKPEAWERLRQFRNALYSNLGRRQDSLFELVDAVLTAPHRSTLVRLSLCSVFRRRWPSTCDALADGCIDVPALRQLFVRSLPDASSPPEERPVWVVDGTIWPRPAARATAERTWEYRPLPGWPQSGVVPAWAYQWLVVVADPAGSWVLPLDVQRRGPTAASATAVALEQITAARAAQPQTSRPVVTLDSGYDLDALARAQVDADLLVRLKKSRVLYRDPQLQPGRGRPRLHGQQFRLADERTLTPPERSVEVRHPMHGRVRVDVWTGLHVVGAPDAPLSVVRIQLERLPNARRPPQPLWLAWIGGSLPTDLTRLWYWYARRFTVEHAFRFFKQSLGWTTVRPRSAEAADRWTWLIAAACWQLWLARPLLTEVRMPWERPRPHGLVTPGQLQRHFTGILVRISTPARAPQPRGKSPGRRPGQRPPPPMHYAVARRPRSPAA
jgi:Transposase DDE domain